MPSLFSKPALEALNHINPENEVELKVKEALIKGLNEAEGDSPDILLSTIETNFNYPKDEEGYEHLCPGQPEYVDGINFLVKYHLMP